MTSFIKKHKYALLILLILFIISLVTHKHYGISWDEPTERTTGKISYEYITGKSDYLHNYKDKDYGVGGVLPLYYLGDKISSNDLGKIFAFRHLLSNVFFIISAFFIYLTFFELIRNKYIGLTSMLLYALTPVIWAHSYFNPKDIPFMSMFAITLYFLFRSIKKNTLESYITFGFFAGYLVSFRIMGIILYPIFIAIELINLYQSKNLLKSIKTLAVFTIPYIIGIMIIWPYLWNAPLDNFIQAFKNMAHFRWIGTTLLFGKDILSSELPWFYIPAFISISLPIGYLICFTLGFLYLIQKTFSNLKNIFSLKVEIFIWINAVILFGSIASVIFLKSILYDSWRQMFFIFPSFIIISGYGIYMLYSNKKTILSYSAYTLASISIISSIWGHIITFPIQHVYYNKLVSRKENHIYNNFTTDYWGTSYLVGLNKILSIENSENIKIMSGGGPLQMNSLLLPECDRRKITFTENMDEADYFISIKRDNKNSPEKIIGRECDYSVSKLNSPIVSIWKLK